MSDARILDQGYRPYEGPRLGVRGAVRSLVRHSAQRALGLRRSAWAKLLPIAAVVIAYLPAAVFVGVAAIVPDQVRDEVDILPTYSEYYGFITAAILLFVAIVGPEVLCPDRRNGMLGLYLASPLGRGTYLLAKTLAVLPVLLLVTLGPPILLLVGFTLADTGPDTLAAFASVLGRIFASAVAVTAVYTAISLAAASLTERRAFASAGVILLVLASSITAFQLVEGSGADAHVMLLNLFVLPFELVQRIYGQPGEYPDISTAALAAAEVAWVAAAAALVRWRYRRLTVTR
jgi:ABC-2 type transport system permease protein